MSIEYLPVGIACNLKCTYCYQDPMRDSGAVTVARDWDAAKRTLLAENYKFTVFGGEPLLAPIEHLREVFAFGLEKYKGNGIQTNGVLITDEHIAMFKEFKVHVGFSIDGPGILNAARAGLDETWTVIGNIKKVAESGNKGSLIVTLTKHNAQGDRLRILMLWIKEIRQYVAGIKYHILEVDSDRAKKELALTNEENLYALTELRKVGEHDMFKDIRNMLLDKHENLACVWNACDPQTTRAVRGVNPDGQLVNCGRTNKDGINWAKVEKENNERYVALYYTPQEFGGCKGCKFFALCKGQCPGTAIDGDWRNRSEHCSVWYGMFSLVERELLEQNYVPVTERPERLRQLELKVLAESVNDYSPHGDEHGDTPHGDIPHGDAHGDEVHLDEHGDSNGVEVTWLN